jgi:hypothetical protein
MLGREHRRPDDPGLVAQDRRDDGHATGEARDEQLGSLAHAAAEDDQVGPEDPVDRLDMLVEVRRPGLPRQPSPHSGRGGRSSLGIATSDLHVAELRVRHERPIDEQPGPDAGPERQDEDDAWLPSPGAEAHLGEPRRVRVVEQGDRPADRPLEVLSRRVVDPGLVDVCGGHRLALENDRGDVDPDREALHPDRRFDPLDEPDDRCDDGRRGRRCRSHDPDLLGCQRAGHRVDGCGLDAAATDVDADGDGASIDHPTIPFDFDPRTSSGRSAPTAGRPASRSS